MEIAEIIVSIYFNIAFFNETIVLCSRTHNTLVQVAYTFQ
jgi:hypothetical protein